TYPTGGYSLTGETPSGQYYIRFYWNGPVRRYATSADLTNGGNVRIKGTIVFQAEYDATWTPERLGAAVVGWFDAASTISLTLVDNKVAAWKNRGVAALSIGQVTAAKRPAYNSAGWDATRPCLSSGGGNDGPILTGPISTLSGNRWLFIVAERAVQDATNTSTALRALVSTGDAAGNRVYPSVLLPSSDAAQTGFRVQASGTGGGAAQVAPWAIDTKAVLFSSIGATMGAGINGATPSGTAALGSGSPVTEFGIFGLVGSATTDKASRLAGKISEVLVIDPTLLPNGGSTFDRQKIEGYLAHKWGIQNSLAAGHPFLTTAPVN
ncbi:hypothetical protein, partial [Sphingobium sp. YR768]|uniref:hypothetical protein n=1 Tax=Sphingobium sp. YR768 TaxID=1884365 RepID=UPI0008D37C08